MKDQKDRPTWWRMFASQKEAVESLPNEAVGEGLKAAFRYFDGAEVGPDTISPMAYTAFCLIKPYIDQAFETYTKSVEAGKKGASARWGKEDSPPMAPQCAALGSHREIRKKKEERGQKRERKITRARVLRILSPLFLLRRWSRSRRTAGSKAFAWTLALLWTTTPPGAG